MAVRPSGTVRHRRGDDRRRLRTRQRPVRRPGGRRCRGFGVPEARGRRVGPRARRLGGKWAMLELGLQRVYAEAAAENVASIRAIEKAGFQREGLLRAHCKTHGRRHDCVMFSIVPSDFADG
ncbi:MAG: GNAT family N-acetyltransferase [Gaiellaceae bacterium]